MEPGQTEIARRTGIAAIRVQIGLQIAYAAVTLAGLTSLPAADQPIKDPWFTLMELLILAMIAPLVLIAAALHLWAPSGRKLFSLAALGFTLALVIVTGLVHFSILTLSRQPAFAGEERLRLHLALAGLCRRHSRLGPVLPLGRARRCLGDPGARRRGPGAKPVLRQRGAGLRRAVRPAVRQHADPQHRHPGLCGGVPRRPRRAGPGIRAWPGGCGPGSSGCKHPGGA